jgi:hypothetical protein
MERWWFHMIAGPDGNEAQIRLVLRVGDDEAAFPTLQITLDGTEVPVDASPVDYEAPEWKAQQLFTGPVDAWDALKDQLRSRV